MFNWGVCDSCKKSKRYNGQSTGCDLRECRYEPMPTNSLNITTSPYAFSENTDKNKEQKNG